MTGFGQSRKGNKMDAFERETARLCSAVDVKLFSDDPQYTDMAVENIGKTLDKIRTKNGWNNSQLMQQLDTRIYKSEAAVSRIINNDNKRQPSAAQFIELRRVFGVDLNAIADGDNPFVLESLSDVCLLGLINQISAELLRRNGKNNCQIPADPSG